jgi:branched-chain amino acid transport system permease protein
MAALAGALLGPLSFVYPTMGTGMLLKGFVIVIVGGMGSIPGAVVGALLLGVGEALGGTFLSYAYKEAIGFMVLAAVLMVRPGGIFGAETRI